MTFISFLAVGKELLLINDSLVIFSVMALLVGVLINNLRPLLMNIFDSIRQNNKEQLTTTITTILNENTTFKSQLEDSLDLNINRGLLVPLTTSGEFEITDPMFESYSFEDYTASPSIDK